MRGMNLAEPLLLSSRLELASARPELVVSAIEEVGVALLALRISSEKLPMNASASDIETRIL